MFKRKIQTCIAISLAVALSFPPAAFATGFNLGAFWKKKIAAVIGPGGWTELPGGEFDMSGGGGGGLTTLPQRVFWFGGEPLVVESSGGTSGMTIKYYNSNDGTWDQKTKEGYGFNENYSWSSLELMGFVTLGLGPSPQSALVGSKIVFWGASNPTDGFVYDITTDSWTTMSAVGKPSSTLGVSVVVANNQVLYWGGTVSGGFQNTGARYDPATNQWQAISTSGAPSGRTGHSAVWTGSEMIVWGGIGGVPIFGVNYPKTGGRYNPSTNSWVSISDVGAPGGRIGHTAVWTGQEMLIWGGFDGSNDLQTGGKYNPTTNTWTPISTVGAPSPRRGHHAYWTGSKMLIWGGVTNDGLLFDGKLYDPATDTWSAMADPPNYISDFQGGLYITTKTAWSGSKLLVWNVYESNSGYYDVATNSWEPFSASSSGPGPRPRIYNTIFMASLGVWADSHMVTWGGLILASSLGGYVPTNTGDRFSPTTGLWSHTSTDGAPEARQGHAIVSTGTKVLVWGGDDGSDYFNSGGVYDVAGDSWSSMSTTNAPEGRSLPAAAWTGSKLFIWGGIRNEVPVAGGALYDLASDSWSPISNIGAPSARYGAHAYWTGTKVIVWGGFDENNDALNDGAMFDPSSNTWSSISTTGAPAPCFACSVTWTGTYLVVWGGLLNDNTLSNTGARYNPQTNTWSPITTAGALSARMLHSAVSMNGKVVIWGGGNENYEVVYNTGAIYDPVANSWSPLSDVDAPEARFGHGAVWTGTQMLIWGGIGRFDEGGVFFGGGGIWTP